VTLPTHRLLLEVALKVADNEARSALEAIRVKMGLAGLVRDLRREEVWELAVDAADADRARSIVAGLVESTNLFANPNKHRTRLADVGDTRAGLDPDEVAILVSDRGSGEGASMVEAVRRLGVRELSGARRWVRWRVRLAEAPSPEEPGVLDLIRRIGVATGRTEGLLCNPHCQVARAVLPWGDEKPLAR
jgi:phosphoribosylformylglycinamidine (FGAM) synthase PurS component